MLHRGLQGWTSRSDQIPQVEEGNVEGGLGRKVTLKRAWEEEVGIANGRTCGTQTEVWQTMSHTVTKVTVPNSLN